MTTEFEQLNSGWNAEPNSPEERVELLPSELQLHFLLNPFQFKAFSEGDQATLRFSGAWRYRLGSTNDEGWYRGQCRFSRVAPKWGEFYEIRGNLLEDHPALHWQLLAPRPAQSRHFLFYLRDRTFECDALDWHLDLPLHSNRARSAAQPVVAADAPKAARR